MVLTVNGRAELIVQDAECYQALLDRLDRAETVAAFRQGIKQIARGADIALKQAERSLRKKLAFRVEIVTPSFQ